MAKSVPLIDKERAVSAVTKIGDYSDEISENVNEMSKVLQSIARDNPLARARISEMINNPLTTDWSALGFDFQDEDEMIKVIAAYVQYIKGLSNVQGMNKRTWPAKRDMFPFGVTGTHADGLARSNGQGWKHL